MQVKVSGGPKHYIFKTKKNKSKVVIKGIKVCYANRDTITFDTLKDIVMNDITKTHTVTESDFFVRKCKNRGSKIVQGRLCKKKISYI